MRAPVLATLLLAIGLAGGGCVKKSTHRRALAQIQTLEGELATTRNDLADRDKRITTLEGDVTRLKGDLDAASTGKSTAEGERDRIRGEKEATEAELVELRKQRDLQEKRLAAYQDLQRRFKSLVETGQVEVTFRNGQMTLKLPSGILFPSGSADLSSAGKETIAQVTEALKALKDRRFLIAGHTDNVPIRTKKFKNNWYLSTARAVSVLEFMASSGFPASQMGAAGYADNDPVGDNTTEAGRELNRRIEIIVVPDLSELPQLAEEPQPQ